MWVDFFFGIGSRYSYLAAAQLPRIASETGAEFRWRTLYSPDLIARTGCDPFDKRKSRGQYLEAYRTLDAHRWAAYLRLPYNEPKSCRTDWLILAKWCAAAELIGAGPRFGEALFKRTFGSGVPPQNVTDLRALASSVRLSPEVMLDHVEAGAAEDLLGRNLENAVAVGAFGVPSFVAEDGSLFWGQDRLPLLAHHLQTLA